MNTISMPGQSASQPPGASPSPQETLALPAPPPLAPTSYLQIVGMVTAEVLADDEEYSEVRQPHASAIPLQSVLTL